MKFREWCVKQHADRNQVYDGYLPYEFHLRMVERVHLQFEDIAIGTFGSEYDIITNACYGHDLIEDTGATYNDIVDALMFYCDEKYSKGNAHAIAEIIRACTCEIRGRNREERMTSAMYEDLREVKGATFVKLCDRIANVYYGTNVGLMSGMARKYKQEMPKFQKELFSPDYEEMFVYLQQLLDKV